LVAGTFTVVLTESAYTGPFTVSIDSYNSLLQGPCYTAAMDASATRATFTPRQEPAIGASGSATSPCAYLSTDVEGALFEDAFGNALQVYYENQPVAASGL